LLLLQARLDAGKPDGVAQKTQDIGHGLAPQMQAQLSLLRWRAMILDGKPGEAIADMKTTALAEKPLPIDPRAAAWLKVLAEFRQVK